MERCAYLLYEQSFLLARGAIFGGDPELQRQLSADSGARSVTQAMAISLALADAKRGWRRRPKAQVCSALAVLCSCNEGDPRRLEGEDPAGDAEGLARRSRRRLARALQVELLLQGEFVRAVTLDVSTGGFSTLLGSAPPEDSRIDFSLRLPRAEPVMGVARVVSTVPRQAHYRVSFSFDAVNTPSLKDLGEMCLAG